MAANPPTEKHRVIEVVVQPASRRDGVVGPYGDALKVRVTAPAEGGRANRAVVALLAAELHVPLRSVEVVGGTTSTRKRIRIPAVDPATLARLFAPRT